MHNSDLVGFADPDRGQLATASASGVTRLRRPAPNRTVREKPVAIAGVRVAMFPPTPVPIGSRSTPRSGPERAASCSRQPGVLLSSRVPVGPITGAYRGAGGGADLVAAGAVPTPGLRPGQTRVVLAALLAAHQPVDPAMVARLAGVVDTPLSTPLVAVDS